MGVTWKSGRPATSPDGAPGRAAGWSSWHHVFVDEYARLLSLRLQPFVHRPGSVILFSDLDGGAMPPSILYRLAERMSQSDRQVAVAFGPHYAAEWAGALGDHHPCADDLDLPAHRLEGAISSPLDVEWTNGPATAQRVDYLRAGDDLRAGENGVDRKGLGARRITQQIDQLRRQYAMAILSGPGVSQAVDLELMASRVDGVILHAFGLRRIDPIVGREIQHLMSLGMPILGVIG